MSTSPTLVNLNPMVWDDRIPGRERFVLADREELMWVPDEIRKCVAFVMYASDTSGQPDSFAGTAFWFMKGSDRIEDFYFGYIVTAWHVIVKCQEDSVDGKVYLRVNTTDGGATAIDTVPSDWFRHPDDTSVDIAVLPAMPSADVVDWQSIPAGMAVREDIIEEEDIGIGDDLFLTGLFAPHNITVGRNVPILRVGNIAAMPGPPVKTRHFGDIEAYLVESRSIGGLSGSPVFVDVRGQRSGGLKIGGQQFYLLGVMQGHWDYYGELPEYDVSSQEEEERRRVNMGIAIVVPVEKLLEALEHPDLVAQRKEQESNHLDDNLPVED